MIDAHTEDMVERHRASGVFIDSNLLLLLAIGRFQSTSIPNHPHTKQYTIADFLLLERFVGLFKTVVSTPNVLTEVSNLAGKLDKRLWSAFRCLYAATIRSVDERHCVSKQVVEHGEFLKVGLTDAGILSLREQDFLLLTDDFQLYAIASALGIDALTFKQIGMLAGLV